MTSLQFQWSENRLEFFSSNRLMFKPIQEQRDLKNYQALFQSPIAMRQYLNGQPRDITARAKIWDKRWERHNFSALAIYLKVDQCGKEAIKESAETFVGHIILGHGDYENGQPNQGWSEVAIVLHPHFWNANHADADKEIGQANQVGIGTEVIEAIREYAQELFKRGFSVPVDVTPEQQAEVKEQIQNEQDYIKNEKGEIETVFIPFREVRATCLRQNVVGHKIFTKVFVNEGGGSIRPHADEKRDLFILPLSHHTPL